MMTTSACSKPEDHPENLAIAKMKSTNEELNLANLLTNKCFFCLFYPFDIFPDVPGCSGVQGKFFSTCSENVISKLNSHYFKPPNRNFSNYNPGQNVWDTVLQVRKMQC